MKKLSLAVILIPIVLLLSTSYFFAFNETFYHNNVPDIEDKDAKITNVLNFLKDKEDLNYFTKTEQIHMQDVKTKLNFLKLVLILAALVLIFIIFYLIYTKHYNFLGNYLFQGAILTLAIIIIIDLISIFNFEQMFIKCHELIFSNYLWMLPSSSELLLMFPLQFFITFIKKVLLTSLILTLLLLGMGNYMKR